MEQKELRNCFGLFATGVMIATTKVANQNYGMTINSFSSVSLDPALLLFSIDSKSSNLEAFKKADNFSLSILGKKQLKLAQEFSKPSNEDKWQVEKYFFGKTNTPIFNNSLGYFECSRQKVIESGDHHIFIGAIVDFAKLSDEDGLFYYRGKFL